MEPQHQQPYPPNLPPHTVPSDPEPASPSQPVQSASTSQQPQPQSQQQPQVQAQAQRQPRRSHKLNLSASQPSLPHSIRTALSPSRHTDLEPRHRPPPRKLHKRPPRSPHPPNPPHMDFPEQLKRKDGDDEHEEDVLPMGLGQGNRQYINMNQSVFGLIAVAGPKVDFHNRFEGYSSEEEDADESDGLAAKPRHDPLADPMAKTTILTKPGAKGNKSHRRKLSDSKLMKSVPILSRLSSRSRSRKGAKKQVAQIQEEEGEDRDDEDEPFSPTGEHLPMSPVDANSLAPVMSRMLEAHAEAAARPSFDLERPMDKRRDASDLAETAPSELSKRLQKIFEFEEPEELISEYPCWLLQGVLLQGYIYITSKHICFYAYLPKKAHQVTKSGYLSKSGKRNPKYNRYWFRLKGDVFSYYRDPSNLYFPHGQIDLRYGISAAISDKDKSGASFTVETDHRTYYFRADSAQSAKDWVKCLQRVIFRSHNDGDSVKISLPIQNVIDIEETQMLEFADTCKIRVIDNDETYAIDEYFFSFFSFGKEAIGVLKILIEDALSSNSDEGKSKSNMLAGERAAGPLVQTSQRSSFNANRSAAAPPQIRTGKLQDNVKATLSPMLSPLSPHSPTAQSPRASGEFSRASFDGLRSFARKSSEVPRTEVFARRSFSRDRQRSTSGQRRGVQRLASTDSTAESTEDPSMASYSAMTTSGELDASASQILRGSDVFHSPTVQRSSSASGQDRRPRSPAREGSAGFVPHHAATTGQLRDHDTDDKAEAAPTLETISKMGAYPLQRVGAFAEYLSRHSKRVGGLLATESFGYAGKFTGAWKGGQRRYDEPAGLRTDDEAEDEEQDKMAEERFQAHFALPKGERLRATYFGYFMRVLPLYGKIYVSDRTFCFRSLMPGTRTKLILPIRDVENVTKSSGFRLGYAGLVVVIRGHEELFFEFGDTSLRDGLAVSLHQGIDAAKFLRESGELDIEEKQDAENAVAEQQALEEARREEFPEHELSVPRQTSSVSDGPTIIFDDPKASFINFKPEKSMRITCLTIGSRGDVQPYIALCKGLLAEGHRVKIATHMEFKDWIEGHGIEFAPVEGDPGELMRLCIENGTFTVSFLQKANATMRTWLDGLLTSSWLACSDSDLLIESPSAMAGIHIAEKLCIPYYRAFGMPWTRTRAYPHAFMTPERKMGGSFNVMTYILFDNVFWKATAHQINKWRNNTLSLPSTSIDRLQPNKVPFLYNFSQHVVPPPMDYSDWIRVTGYWFLDEGGKDWTPPDDLVSFIDNARKDGKKLVYIGFGSIILDNPAKFTREIIDAVLKADVRCILSKGWSDRLDPKAVEGQDAPTKQAAESSEIPLPPEILAIKSAPHDWLFKQIDAAVHHGGSGTTGASLRAGIPTIIRPFFGDQFFFGGRVEDLGVGISLKKWGVNSFARALWEATHSERMIVKAKVLGENIRNENGVDTAIQCIYRDMEYAKSLIEKKAMKNAAAADRAATSGSEEVDDDAEEESWTFVGDADDEEIDVDAALKRSSLFLSSTSDHGGKALGTRATIPHSSVLWTNTGITVPISQRTAFGRGNGGDYSNSSVTSGSTGEASPRGDAHERSGAIREEVRGH